MNRFINALFVETNGPYFGISGVEPWDIVRDAKKCDNGAPAVAHPPCERWGRYWSGGPSAKIKRKLGDDAGCFAFALWYVRTFGGVIEHPEASHAYKFFGINRPGRFDEKWIAADIYGGFVTCVEQGNYGHPARKATWLYANKTELPKLRWGASEGKMRLDAGFHSKEKALVMRALPDYQPIKRLSEFERLATPLEFRDVLISIAQSAR